MRDFYLNLIINYGALIAAVVSLIFFLSLVYRPKLDFNQSLAFLLLLLTTLISLEFYEFQMGEKINVAIPIGIVLLLLMKITKKYSFVLTGIMMVLFSVYTILGLMNLSANSTTWRDGPVVHGSFIVANSIAILLVLFTMHKKQHLLFMSCQAAIGIVGFAVVYFLTNGFHCGEYCDEVVTLRRITVVIICLISLLNTLLVYRLKKMTISLK